MWKQLPIFLPHDTEIVWIRTQRWAGASFLAEWNVTAQTFTTVTDSMIYPIYAVAYWKTQ